MALAVRAHLVGLGGALAGAPLTLLLVLALNRAAAAPPEGGRGGQVSFQVQAPPPRPKKQPARERPRPAPRSAPRAPLPAAPSLGAPLSGVDVGLGSFALDPLEAVDEAALGDVDDVVHTEDTVDTRPAPSATTPIEVPAAARARNLSGRVVLSLRIGAGGAVEAVKVVEATPPGVFEDAAVQAVQRWRFEPATYRGKPVAVWATLPIEFTP